MFNGHISCLRCGLFDSHVIAVIVLQVQNAIEYLKTIGALDEDENLTVLGKSIA